MTATILVPIDFSDCTDKVIRRAVEVAHELTADVLLMHSVQLPAALDANVPVGREAEQGTSALRLLEDEARQRLTDYAEQLRAHSAEGAAGSGDLNVTLTVTVGPPAVQILELAEKIGATRIVMGTRGRKGLSKLLLGSVAQRVADGARCPTVIVESKWSPTCKAASCHWCASGRTDAQQQLEAELDG